MNPILRNVLAVIAGYIIGSVVNISLIFLGIAAVPLPEQIDIMKPETMAEFGHLMTTKNFIFPFLAHALGTLAGAFAVSKIAVSNQKILSLAIGAFFLIGGIISIMRIPSPTWFNILDIVGAYIPMALLGWMSAGKPE